MQNINAASSPEVQMNENFDTLSHAAVYGKYQALTSGLNWGHYGGMWGGFSSSDDFFVLADDDTNYMVVNRANGTPSMSNTSTNWDDTSHYGRVYKITTASGVVTAVEDHRAGLNGVHGPFDMGVTIGRHSLRIPIQEITPSAAGGCAARATIASSANHPDITTLDFDQGTPEYAQFAITMPKMWNEGTITFKPIWSHDVTTVNFGVAWSLQALAVSDNESIDQAFGTAILSVDTGGVTNNLYKGPESAAITIAGSPAAEDTVFFRVSRVTGDAGDTMAIDARLHEIVLYITTAAATDS